ncbi:MAG: hypothetical protein EOM50_04995 [Erysipelotrichia bacterium]|nr:hypothetical protein [Erysipelotrichia bacterium]
MRCSLNKINNKVIIKLVGILIVTFGVLTSFKVSASAVNDYIINNKVKPSGETLSLGRIYNQDPNRNGGTNMDYTGGKPKIMIIHEVGVDGGSINGSIDYMVRTQDSAFVHSFVDGSQLITIADKAKKSWGSGQWGNNYGIQIEQMRVTTSTAFYKQIATLAKWTADQLIKYDMGAPKLMSSPSSPQKNNLSIKPDGNLASHKMIAYKFNQTTDHVDPDAYWARFGYDMNQFRDLVAYYYKPLPTILSADVVGYPDTGHFGVRVKTTGDPASVLVPISLNKNSQTIVHWYKANKVKDGEYLALFDASNHNYESGRYQVLAYAFDANGNSVAGRFVTDKLQVTVENVKFGDISSKYYFSKEINWLAETGVTYGRGTDLGLIFAATDNVTRGEMAAFLYRYAGSPTFIPSAAMQSQFQDVNVNTMFSKEIWWLASTGITIGRTINNVMTFAPDDRATRGEIAAFLYRYAGSPTFNPTEAQKVQFGDVGVNSMFATEVWWLASTKITIGRLLDTGLVFATGDATRREEMAAFLYRFNISVIKVGTPPIPKKDPVPTSPTPVFNLSGVNDTQKAWLNAIYPESQKLAMVNDLFPSIMMSQAIAESAWGQSELATKANNLFGIEADATWKGAIYTKVTNEVVNGQTIQVTANFRKYNSQAESLTDYVTKIRTTMNGSAYRYQGVWRGNARTYQNAAQALKDGGYETDPDYPKNLIDRIVKYRLDTLD